MISFYVPSEEYGFLCNFSAHGFTFDDRYWPTVEHYFQAQKFAGPDHEERTSVSRTPKEAKNLGQSRKLPLRSDWEDVKVDVMRNALMANSPLIQTCVTLFWQLATRKSLKTPQPTISGAAENLVVAKTCSANCSWRLAKRCVMETGTPLLSADNIVFTLGLRQTLALW